MATETLDKNKALAILRTIAEPLKAGTKKTALESVAEYIQRFDQSDIYKMTPDERDARIKELMTKARNGMSIEERREEAAFYLEGIISKEDFRAFEEETKNAFIKQFGQRLIE